MISWADSKQLEMEGNWNNRHVTLCNRVTCRGCEKKKKHNKRLFPFANDLVEKEIKGLFFLSDFAKPAKLLTENGGPNRFRR